LTLKLIKVNEGWLKTSLGMVVTNCLRFCYRFYRGSHGVIVVYDVSRIESFANVKRWLQEIDQNCDAAVQKVLGMCCLRLAYVL